jgi:type II secretory pathway pseudopilin PulG
VYKKSTILKGFTLTELMVGLSIGIVVLTGLMSFYFRSAKIIGEQQTIVKDLNQLQFVMNKIVQDIKECNTVPPEMSSVTKAEFDALPYMGYGRINPYNEVTNQTASLVSYNLATTEPKEYPIYPVAYNFSDYQLLKSTTSEGWYPRQNPLTETNDLLRESNQLVFYKVQNNQILRVIYYLDLDPSINPTVSNDLKIYNLKRRTQYPPISQGLILKDNDTSSKEVTIISNVKFIQFTYPILAKKLADTAADPDFDPKQYDPVLRALLNNEGNGAKQSILMNPYRNTIKIRIATAGPQIGDKRIKAFELSTEVTVRN